jgi:hypothetical protein
MSDTEIREDYDYEAEAFKAIRDMERNEKIWARLFARAER